MLPFLYRIRIVDSHFYEVFTYTVGLYFVFNKHFAHRKQEKSESVEGLFEI